MGFLKRIFSFGSKKKRSPAPPTSAPSFDNERRRKLEEEHEAAVGRILRSSSSRYAIVKETDYSNLPPLPHPINDVLAGCNTTPKEGTSLRLSPSVASLASSSLSRHSTFSVTVHDRQRHAATEFPNANRELGDDTDTPTQRSKRHSHQLGLRSDPSVVSLISLYDEHGRLPAEAFSNSPPSAEKQERPQKKRGGSTLRELLGGPDSLDLKSGGHLESDISWAEQFLREDENNSSPSSLGPHTPSACMHSTHDYMTLPKARDLTFSSESSTSIPNDPAITSMEAEFGDTSSARDTNTDLTTPQRASQIFSFITKRNPVKHERVPSLIPFSSSLERSYDAPCSRFSTDESSFDGRTSRQSRSSLATSQESSITPMQRIPKLRTVPDFSVAEDDDDTLEYPQRKVRVLMTGPTKIMVTEPTPNGQSEQVMSRIPIRGLPHNPYKRKVPHTRRTPMLTLTQRTNIVNNSASRGSVRLRGNPTGIPRHRPSRRSACRVSIASSTMSSFQAEADALAVATACALDQLARDRACPQVRSPTRTPRGGDKENQSSSGALFAKVNLPSTPLRSHTIGKGPLSRKVVTPSLFQRPGTSGVLENSLANMSGGGGNSSSELSPLGKQMMLDARQQRMRVKEWDKERRNGGCSTPSTRAAGQPF